MGLGTLARSRGCVGVGRRCLGLTHLGSFQYGAETEVVAAAGFGEGNLDAAPGKRSSPWALAPAFESPCH